MEFAEYLAAELRKLEGQLTIKVTAENGRETRYINIPHTTAELLAALTSLKKDGTKCKCMK